MKRIWFRVGMECEITDYQMEKLRAFSRQGKGECNCEEAEDIMRAIIEKADLSGETYILGKDCGGVDDYDNPEREINFWF